MTYSYEESEELTLLRQTVRKFAESEIAPVAGKLDEEDGYMGTYAKLLTSKSAIGWINLLDIEVVM